MGAGHGPLTRIAGWLVPPENPAGEAYGIIIVAALLAAEGGQHESHLDAIASAIIAGTLSWLAHAYSELLGRRLAVHERLTAHGLAQALRRDLAILRGAALPIAALVFGSIVGASQEGAVTIALWSAVASLVALELTAGVRSGASPRELAFDACAGVAMGLGILAVKIVLH